MSITEELLNELRDVQLTDNSIAQADRAWREIEMAVFELIPPLERRVSFLEARVKYLEAEAVLERSRSILHGKDLLEI